MSNVIFNNFMAENNKQITELTKQTAVNSTDIKALDKRFDILFYLIEFLLFGYQVFSIKQVSKPPLAPP